MTNQQIHAARSIHNPTWVETEETLKVTRDLRAEECVRSWWRMRQAAWKLGQETRFLTENPESESHTFVVQL